MCLLNEMDIFLETKRERRGIDLMVRGVPRQHDYHKDLDWVYSYHFGTVIQSDDRDCLDRDRMTHNSICILNLV